MKSLLALAVLATFTPAISADQRSGVTYSSVKEIREYCEVAQDPENPRWLTDPDFESSIEGSGIQGIWASEETCNADTVNWMVQTGRIKAEPDNPDETWYNQLRCAASLIALGKDDEITFDVLSAEFDRACPTL